jgi:hypothetical protein
MQQKKNLIFFIVLASFALLFDIHTFKSTKNNKQTDEFTTRKPAKVYVKSHHYVVNNNLAQYSAYVYDSGDFYKIEAFVVFNLKNINDNITSLKDLNNHLKPELYLCFVKFLDSKSDDEEDGEIVMKLNTVGIQQYFYHDYAKLTFQFHSTKNIENIVIGVIFKNDYQKELSEIKENSDKIVLPYSMINFQKPVHLASDKLGKTVGLCAHCTFGNFPSHAQNWIDIHLSLGIGEVILYDSTIDEALKKKINQNKRVVIKPYRINQTDFCESVTSEDMKIGEILKRHCLNFYELEFKDLSEARIKHEHLTANDCYFQLSKKHEYVAYYDLDEFIMPRAFESSFDCNKFKICSLKPFGFDRHFNDPYLFYNYLENIVEKYHENQNKTMLSSIVFRHAAYVVSNNITGKLIDDLIVLIEKINTTKFPQTIETTEGGYRFIVERKHFGHIKTLVKSFKASNSCSFDSINSKLDKTFQRFIYFITEPEQGLLKSVYFSKNVKSLFTNAAIPNTWILMTTPKDGHRLFQFRHEINDWRHIQINSSISNLNLDFEYLTFALKEFTEFC